MRRILDTTAGCNPLASSLSMKRRNPLWTTFLIFIAQPIRTSVRCHVTPYGQFLAEPSPPTSSVSPRRLPLNRSISQTALHAP